MILRVVSAISRGPVDQTFVVIGPAGERIRTALSGQNVTFVINPNPASEMIESVRCGLGSLPEQCTAVLVTPGDIPRLDTEGITELIRVFHTANHGIVVPTFEHRRGHPLLFAKRYCNEVLSHYDAVGLRGLLQAHPEDICEVPLASAGILDDVDSPSDYQRVVRRIE